MCHTFIVVVMYILNGREGRLSADRIALRSWFRGVDNLANVTRENIWLAVLAIGVNPASSDWLMKLTLTAVLSSSSYASRAFGMSSSFGILKSVVLFIHFCDILVQNTNLCAVAALCGLTSSSCLRRSPIGLCFHVCARTTPSSERLEKRGKPPLQKDSTCCRPFMLYLQERPLGGNEDGLMLASLWTRTYLSVFMPAH